MDKMKILEIAALLTHSFFLNEFCIAKSSEPKKSLNPNTEEVVKQIFENYTQEIVNNPMKF